jgi:hypothetical protein
MESVPTSHLSQRQDGKSGGRPERFSLLDRSQEPEVRSQNEEALRGSSRVNVAPPALVPFA